MNRFARSLNRFARGAAHDPQPAAVRRASTMDVDEVLGMTGLMGGAGVPLRVVTAGQVLACRERVGRLFAQTGAARRLRGLRPAQVRR